ncbi:NFACT protein C-terminal [Arabidopsis thaliana x Arabidopsis arenosa]|uniref:NFACT protein C-terminal n=1 Tax=Arabidopsis thaliana x Arabidopsis arenosa TaxID=1240361 RepID=A0A8T1XPD7_9BRAS|nr:NFACT protein C-terminal [Arabidopsis thaliana x Arabidopsis arenosa]
MVKVRMNTADVAAEVKCLKRLIGMRCSNVYDISPKTYMFKLLNSSGITESGESEKVLLLMESGVRLHTTAYVRDKSNTPSGFTLKLRKHIRTRRLEDVRQLGYDRIIVFQFGLGANAHYVILELYAQGNIILTDSEYMIMTLLRSHRDDNKGFAIMSRHRYPIEICRVFERTTVSKLQESLTAFSLKDHEAKQIEPKEQNGGKKGGKSNDSTSAKLYTLKNILGDALGYGPQLSEHIILDAGLIPTTKLSEDKKLDDNEIQLLVQAVIVFEDWLEDIINGQKVPEGYILMQKQILANDTPSESGGVKKMYDEFCSILLNQFKSRVYEKFETFDAALDEFYSKIESQRSEQQQKAKEDSASQKLNKIRQDQENRVQILKKEVNHCVNMAELIEYNLEDVDAAILAVRVALAKGMGWDDLARMVKEEKKLGNPVAGLIDKLYLEKNCMTLLLCNNLDEMDDDEKTLPVEKVEVDLSLSAHGNARRWYEMKKKQETKQEKTVSAHEKAFRAAEKKTRHQLSQEKVVATISHMRKIHWFEKFNWFISSENYLVISGRDAQQNEMIVKRYMSKGDLYVHAELHGASSTVIKNHKPEQNVPPLTLNQAGCFTVCHSQAWDSKIVTSAWWVYPHQVTKTAPTGEYLTVGSFMIRGKKNFLPPHPLIMGFGLLFRLDESSLGAHLNERRVRGEEEGMNDVVMETHAPDEHSDAESENEAVNEAVSASGEVDLQESSTALSQDTSSFDMNSSGIAEENIESTTSQLEDLLDRTLGLGTATVAGKKDTIETSKDEMEEKMSQEEKKAVVRDKPYMSKAERRKLKMGQSGNTAVDGNTGQEKQQRKEKDVSSLSQANKSIPDNKPAGEKVSRGQRGKLKKMKEKYADQDEDERKIRMALLASSGKPQKTDVESQNAKTAVTVEKKPSEETEDAVKICYRCKKVGHLARDCHGKETSEMDKVVMEEDDIHEVGDEEKEKLIDVDYLTGNPLPTDILLYAVPVCGPYNALQSYKYRVKAIPGSMKKGKAAKTAMNLFTHMTEATVREKELMKACTDPELMAALVGNVKITAAGLTQLKQKQKKGKKSGKQQHS